MKLKSHGTSISNFLGGQTKGISDGTSQGTSNSVSNILMRTGHKIRKQFSGPSRAAELLKGPHPGTPSGSISGPLTGSTPHTHIPAWTVCGWCFCHIAERKRQRKLNCSLGFSLLQEERAVKNHDFAGRSVCSVLPLTPGPGCEASPVQVRMKRACVSVIQVFWRSSSSMSSSLPLSCSAQPNLLDMGCHGVRNHAVGRDDLLPVSR